MTRCGPGTPPHRVPHLYGCKSPKWLRAIEYLTEDRRGFREQRGYHDIADPWKEQRYSHTEQEGDGPTLPAAQWVSRNRCRTPPF